MTYSLYRPSFADTTEVLRPSETYREGDPRTQYWKKHGLVYFHDQVVHNSDSASFLFYLSGIAADRNGCFYNARRKPTLDPSSLRAYSFAYFGDAHGVRTRTAEVKGADVQSFKALDSGIRTIPGGEMPHILIACGYAKDRDRVYFCDGGNAMPVMKADPQSFEAIADEFGADARHVFHGRASLPKANRPTWRRLAGAFSTDGVRVYSRNYVVEGADPDSFTVYPDRWDGHCYASDRDSYYGGRNKITRAEFERAVGDA